MTANSFGLPSLLRGGGRHRYLVVATQVARKNETDHCLLRLAIIVWRSGCRSENRGMLRYSSGLGARYCHLTRSGPVLKAHRRRNRGRGEWNTTITMEQRATAGTATARPERAHLLEAEMRNESSIEPFPCRKWRASTALVCAAFALLVFQSAAHAQSRRMSLDQALALPRVETALQSIDKNRDHAVARLIQIGSIISPSGHEQKRAAEVSRDMRAIGLQDVQVDAVNNVTGSIPGSGDGTIVFVSTLDDLKTVAENQEAAKQPLHAEGDRVIGPGSNTSTTTVSMLAAANAFLDAGLKPERTLVFAAVAQEETGLTGMRALYKGDRDRATAFVEVLGDGSSITYGAITIHWWKVNAHGPAGHTLGGGLPNVNQGIGRAVDRILQLPYDKHYAGQNNVVNVAILQSGTVFNHKPDTGWFSLDVRSSDGTAVDTMESDVRSILQDVSAQTHISFNMEVVDQTPGGQIPGMKQGDLVQTSAQIARHLGLTPKLSALGSSNMNIAIGGGTPAIGLGGERGGARGEPGEWADVPQMMRTAKHVLLLAVTMGGVDRHSK